MSTRVSLHTGTNFQPPAFIPLAYEVPSCLRRTASSTDVVFVGPQESHFGQKVTANWAGQIFLSFFLSKLLQLTGLISAGNEAIKMTSCVQRANCFRLTFRSWSNFCWRRSMLSSHSGCVGCMIRYDARWRRYTRLPLRGSWIRRRSQCCWHFEHLQNKMQRYRKQEQMRF